MGLRALLHGDRANHAVKRRQHVGMVFREPYRGLGLCEDFLLSIIDQVGGGVGVVNLRNGQHPTKSLDFVHGLDHGPA